MLGVVRSQTPETSKNLSTRHPAFSGGEASNNHWLTVIVTRFTSCCQTTGRGLGSDLRVALVLLGTKTNFSILPRERGARPAPTTQLKGKRMLKSLSSGRRKHNYTRKLIWFPVGEREAGMAKPGNLGDFQGAHVLWETQLKAAGQCLCLHPLSPAHPRAS